MSQSGELGGEECPDAGLDEVGRIKTIVSPKIEETIQVLQELVKDLQDQESGQMPAQGSETGAQDNHEAT